MWCGAFSPFGTSRNQTRRGRPGSRSSVTRRTVCGVVDLFRCESAVLRTHWVLVVMDHCTRRIVGFGVHRGAVDGVGLCRMFNRATRGHTPPTYLSSDHDPLYRFHQWQANLRILDVEEIKTVPYAPLSHPFVERLIGTIRRECLDRTLFWTAADLEMKLLEFQRYYNGHRAHAGLDGRHAGTEPGRGRRAGECPFVSLAAALSWALSDADGGVRCVRDACGRQLRRRRRVDRLARPCGRVLSEPGVEFKAFHSVRSCILAAHDWEFATHTG